MDYELYHHGVKGQKWGVRRARKKVDNLRAKANKYKSWADYETRERKKVIKSGTGKAGNIRRSEAFSNKYNDKAKALREKANSIQKSIPKASSVVKKHKNKTVKDLTSNTKNISTGRKVAGYALLGAGVGLMTYAAIKASKSM